MYIVSTQKTSDFAGKMAARSMLHLSYVEKKRFPDGEMYVRVPEKLQSQDVIVVGNTRSDEEILELLLLLNAIEEQKPSRTTIVIPYFGYSRQHTIYKEGEAISSKVLMRAISNSVDRIVTVDIHDEASFKYTDKECYDFKAAKTIAKSHRGHGIDMVIAPDDGALKRAEIVSAELKVPSTYLHKKRINSTTVEYEKQDIDVKGKNLLLVDDIISTGGTILRSVEILKNAGAKKIFVAATHGLFVNGAAQKISKVADGLSVTDTIMTDYSTMNVSDDVADYLGGNKQ
ncbi:ribose-phosphate diphosphokinase [Cuniculiplasma sp. SKW3]|uniref:ribose-phosphate diphosphokinase n=1 Tax=unclassified Cuniculiplasma TaxID=2619706 RepID=UPI003FD3CF21